MGRWFGVLRNSHSCADTFLITLILVTLHGVRVNYGCMCPHFYHLVQFLNTSRLQQTESYWKYTGSSTSQEWTPDMAAGTEVVFQVIDENGANITSDAVTVQVCEMIGIRSREVAIADICELLCA